jgi:hypothetical protein
MDERVLKWLYDIQLAIQEIETFFGEDEKDFFTILFCLSRKKDAKTAFQLS